MFGGKKSFSRLSQPDSPYLDVIDQRVSMGRRADSYNSRK